MCIDFRALNANTIIDRYPIPRIDDILDRLGGSMVYSKIDLTQAYHQVEVAESDRHRTAFQSRWGLFEYTVLPFGLVNAPATFQRLMDHILKDKLDVFAMVYLDDILIFSKTEAEHEQHLRWVLDKLREHHLKAKRKKSAFGLNELSYLGHVIKQGTICMEPQKVDAITKWPVPLSVKDL